MQTRFKIGKLKKRTRTRTLDLNRNSLQKFFPSTGPENQTTITQQQRLYPGMRTPGPSKYLQPLTCQSIKPFTKEPKKRIEKILKRFGRTETRANNMNCKTPTRKNKQIERPAAPTPAWAKLQSRSRQIPRAPSNRKATVNHWLSLLFHFYNYKWLFGIWLQSQLWKCVFLNITFLTSKCIFTAIRFITVGTRSTQNISGPGRWPTLEYSFLKLYFNNLIEIKIN